MSIASRIRSGLPLFQRIIKAVSSPSFANGLRSYSIQAKATEKKVKVPLALFGGSGNYATALFTAASRANALEKVESELKDVVAASKKNPIFSEFCKDLSVPRETRVKAITIIFSETGYSDITKNFLASRANALEKVESELKDVVVASKKSPLFSEFCKDLSVPRETRVKAITTIFSETGYSDITKNFLAVLAQNGRLKNMELIAKRFVELTMAHRGEVKVIVTTVIPIPAQEEKEVIQALKEMVPNAKSIKIEQKIDPSILGGLVIEFNQKVYDTSIRTRAKKMAQYLREPLDFGNF